MPAVTGRGIAEMHARYGEGSLQNYGGKICIRRIRCGSGGKILGVSDRFVTSRHLPFSANAQGADLSYNPAALFLVHVRFPTEYSILG